MKIKITVLFKNQCTEFIKVRFIFKQNTNYNCNKSYLVENFRQIVLHFYM